MIFPEVMTQEFTSQRLVFTNQRLSETVKDPNSPALISNRLTVLFFACILQDIFVCFFPMCTPPSQQGGRSTIRVFVVVAVCFVFRANAHSE